ncbi:hypothetical protein COX86_00015 [Candidatus Micrarchaeota archaeon CG_4_10_14_0_2_um_filter_60_11]|nr:MAG: hypothetical protein AUJ16_04680 [Candidatus Micrarchaeota archaeon CG1_02_60_51]PIN95809.1 MAG: hypothetical protein COU39_03930 [Candidatus Micrarchaeota archaeon CG10_big_fil_rev_8_21_14_0_10_60_32]PIO01639.1 MAG: hypothetical protein COT58_04125 [Candidatus Micrarchaeota archaeon CG09_land_8_20_14_0_10_60_16]PIY91881.1 MAG: hypothetical protein COY71_00780 [Candidatus Micrarchaeota archaeon CG_4_10_14_0_8_um_filter_60_7]PIZ91364.1 MAG: hypothetical protein COX86_00015 [Candidatus Mi
MVGLKIKDEILKTIKGLEDAGFKPVDAVFEGAMGVKEDQTLAFLDSLDAKQLVSGVIRVIYTADGTNIRFLEIPVGQQSPDEAESKNK